MDTVFLKDSGLLLHLAGSSGLEQQLELPSVTATFRVINRPEAGGLHAPSYMSNITDWNLAALIFGGFRSSPNRYSGMISLCQDIVETHGAGCSNGRNRPRK